MTVQQAPQASDAPGAPTGHTSPSQGTRGTPATTTGTPEARCQSCGQATEECRAHLTSNEAMEDSRVRGVFSAGICRMPRYHDNGVHEGRKRTAGWGKS